MSGAVKLRVGGFEGDGTLSANSMARAIDDALATQVPLRANEDPIARRKLAIAIAQGVIGHLAANAQAFMTTVRNNTGTATHEQPATQIDVW